MEWFDLHAPKFIPFEWLIYQALLKIVKHCEEHVPKLVTGSLLGLDMEETLEVSNCFPNPYNEEDGGDTDDVAYQMEMMRLLQDVCFSYPLELCDLK